MFQLTCAVCRVTANRRIAPAAIRMMEVPMPILLDATARHVAPDEERQRNDCENDENFDQHEFPFFEVSEQLALARQARRGSEADPGCRKPGTEAGDHDEVQAREREATLACAA